MPSLLGRVMMALELSGVACFVVIFLDKIDDFHAGSEDSQAGARAIQQIITALGILVGFSWEHCFEGSVGAVAGLTDHPRITKLVLGCLVTILVVPAWRKYVLVKAMMLEELKMQRESNRQKGMHISGGECAPLLQQSDPMAGFSGCCNDIVPPNQSAEMMRPIDPLLEAASDRPNVPRRV